MIAENRKKLILDKLNGLFNEENSIFPQAETSSIVSHFLDKKEYYLNLLKNSELPCYLFEPEVLKKKVDTFKDAFNSLITDTGFYFAMKCNNHPELSGEMIKNGFGLDVSSGLELEQALSLGCEDIVFSGPGKTDKELRLALNNSKK